MRNRLLLPAIAALSLALGACAGPTPYQPASASSMRTGYQDYRIDPTHFRVSFSGNSVTSRDTVERYLLYRAAELTLQSGNDWFTTVRQDTERKTRTYLDQPFSPGPFGYWGPYWTYRSPGFGWRTWDPYWGDPFWDRSVDVRTVDQYQAYAEIMVGRGPVPRGDPHAFDARAVIDNLRPTIRLPD